MAKAPFVYLIADPVNRLLSRMKFEVQLCFQLGAKSLDFTHALAKYA